MIVLSEFLVGIIIEIKGGVVIVLVSKVKSDQFYVIYLFDIGKFFASSIKQTKTFIFELGLQNGTIAIFVADTFFGEVAFIIPAVTYSLIMFMTSIICVFLIKNK